jgi:hypothetical protein
LDPWAALTAALNSPYTGSVGYRPPPRSFGWSSSYSLGRQPQGWASFAKREPKLPPPVAPERIDFKLPVGQPPQPPTPPKPTTGDWGASLGASIGSLIDGGVNLANAVPWFMERVGVAAHEMAASDVPVVKQAGQLAGVGTDAFLGAVQAASQVVGPVLEALPNFYRDQQLEDRARLYRAIVTGEEPGIEAHLTLGSLMRRATAVGYDPFDEKLRAFKAYAELYRHTKGSAVSPKEMAELIDLPEDVMARIREAPNGDLNKYLDEGAEGRRFSYRFGVGSTIADLGFTLALYGGEAVVAGPAVFGAIRAVPGAAEALTAARTVPVLSRTTTLAGAITKPFTIAAKLQTHALAAGLGMTGVTTAVDTVMRYQGNQAAIDFFDRINREHPMSDDPKVQLATSFSVNPFAAVNLARKGVVRLSTGMGDVVVGKVLGREIARTFTYENALDGLVQKMYRLGNRAEARAFIEERLGGRAVALDHVVGLAADTALSKLPSEERVLFRSRFPDGLEQTKAVLETYGASIRDIMRNHPDELVARFEHAWQYHGFVAPFNPDIAAAVALDSRGGLLQTYEFRQAVDAVQGYTEAIPPVGQELVRTWLDAAGDMIPLTARAKGGVMPFSIDLLIERMPAFRNYSEGLIPAGAKEVPRQVVETMLERASADYAAIAKSNPLRAKTGADPILRPDSPTPVRDLADALGVDEPIADALTKVNTTKPAGEHVDALRSFLVEHAGLSQADAVAMSPVEVATRAALHAEDRVEPWRAAGQRIVDAEKRLKAIDARVMAIHANDRGVQLGNRGARRAALPERIEFDELLAERRVLAELVAAAQSHTTWAESVARAARGSELLSGPAKQAIAEAAVKKVDAMRRLDELAAISDAVKPAADVLALEAPDLLAAMRKVDGAWRFGPEAADTLAPELIERLRKAVMRLHERNVPEPRISKRTSPVAAERRLAIWRTKVTAVSNQFLDAPPAVLVAEVRRSKTLRDRLRAEDPDLAAEVEALGPEAAASLTGRMLDEKVAEALGVETADEAAAVLGGYREAQDAILDPGYSIAQNRARLRRTADRRVPEGYVASLTERIRPIHADPMGELAHLDAIERVRLAIVNGTYEAVGPTIERDARLMAAVEDAAEKLGVDVDTMLADPRYGPEIRRAVVPPGWKPRIPGAEETPLDAAITSGDPANLAPLMEQVQTALQALPDPITGVSLEEAIAVARPTARQSDAYSAISRQIKALRTAGDRVAMGRGPAVHPVTGEATTLRALRTETAELVAQRAKTDRWATAAPAEPPSAILRRRVLERGGDMHSEPDVAILADPANATGLRVLSLLDRGSLDGTPATVGTTVELLRTIEKGIAARIGIGTEMAAEAQRVATAILERARVRAATEGIEAGVFTKGVHPSMLPVDEMAMARELLGPPEMTFQPNGARPMIVYDPANPLGSLQYGLKRRPKDAVVLELSRIPGLAEEFFERTFKPWEERVATARVRHALNWVFGRLGNREIEEALRSRFLARSRAEGVSQEVSSEIWTAWQKTVRESRYNPVKRKLPTGELTYLPSDGRLYGTPRNIATNKLGEIAHETLERVGTRMDTQALLQARRVDFGRIFRDEAAPLVLRAMREKGVPLGNVLTGMHGKVTGNAGVAFLYHMFRFAADIRYHAMNFVESQILYAGRAMLRPGEIDRGMFGMTETYLRNLDLDPMSNTGYAAGRDRAAYTYKTFLKEQPEVLRGKVRQIERENPELMEQALREMAEADPQLRDMLAHVGHSPDRYLREMDRWYQKMLGTADDAQTGAVLDDALAAEMRVDPAMAQVYGELRQANMDLWSNVRATFYGNAERSRAERFLNNYLLYWPLSYQIKSSKWLVRVLFDRAGGIQTNAAGAYLLSDMAAKHEEKLVADPEYRQWFQKHDTLVFVAQMLMPITHDSMGVSLNPAMRSIFFGRTKAVWDIGPIFTVRHVVQPGMGELYADLQSVPGIDEAYRTLTGREPPGG